MVIHLIVLSRNKVTSITQLSSRKQLELMKKLNQKKIKWIVKEVTKRDQGVWTIAQTQNITNNMLIGFTKSINMLMNQSFFHVEENLDQ